MSRRVIAFTGLYTLVVLLVAIVPQHGQAQSPADARKQLQEQRRVFGRAAEALRQFDEQMKSKDYDAATSTLEQVVALKARLDKAKLPGLIKRTVDGWGARIQHNVEALESAGVKLPGSLRSLTPSEPESRSTPTRPAGNARFDISGAQGIAVDGVRQLADYEEDSYGPLPFPETVSRFVEDEITLLLSRQREDGSFEFLGGRTREAGGTVGFVIQASLCGYSFRKHVEVNPPAIEKAIAKALDYVVYMVRSGKLRPNTRDAAWRYVYALRFLVNEYPHVKNEKTKVLVEDACLLLLNDLRDMQQATKGAKSQPVNWRIHVSPGMRVGDHDVTGRAMVVDCPEDSIAYKAGVRQGDLLLTANDVNVSTMLAYYMEQMKWLADETIHLKVRRSAEEKTIAMYLPPRFPGTLGITYKEDGEGRIVVDEVESVARLGGIAVGDRIIQVDGTSIASAKQLERLELFSGQVVKVQVEREGKPRTLSVQCMPAQAANLGITIKNGVDQSTKDGLEIQNIANDSCLKGSGIVAGDRILRINDTPVVNRRLFRELERTLWAGKDISVTYLSKLDGQEKTVQATTGARPYQEWLSGYHGITLERSRSGDGAIIKSVDAGSPADVAGCRLGDKIEKINGLAAEDYDAVRQTLSSVFGGQEVRLTVLHQGETKELEFVANRPTESPWISGSAEKAGGWVYYTYVRGGTTFLTSDALRVLVRARENLPIHIPEELLAGPFMLLSNLRKTQPNSEVESYRYDAGGSFWNVKDIRGDVGRLCAAELACLMYCDSDLEHEEELTRTQRDLARTCREFLKHRGILDYAKTGDHQKFSIAPWYWPYSYLTTLQAAEYLKGDDELKDQVQRTCLKAYFKYSRRQFVKDLDAEGWMIGYYPRKTLLRSCLLLDGLATMKHLYRRQVDVRHPALEDAMAKFNKTEYGSAYTLLQAAVQKDNSSSAELAEQAGVLGNAIDDRYTKRLNEIKEIHKKYYRDAIRYLEEMQPHFQGHPGSSEIDDLLTSWKAALPQPD